MILAVVCIASLVACGLLSARSGEKTVKARVRLLTPSGDKLSGIIRIVPMGQTKAIDVPGLYPRLRGLSVPEAFAGWFVVPAGGAEITLPKGIYRLEALSGLETRLASAQLDLSDGKSGKEIELRLAPIFDPAARQLVSGNTHLHLAKLTRADAEDYLKQIPAADGLRVLFISYLERHKEDAEYVTNHYPVGDLAEFKATGVLVNNGEEHRHNFSAYGEGYGHVMFLNLKSLVKPVSLGPGITGGGFDDRPLRPGIDEAHKQGATVIWCHNSFGFEGLLSALSGRLDALNVFDGGRRGTFEGTYYRYLNLGLRLPLSTGTDWFLYDFARVYAQVPGKLTIASWLDALKAGRCQVSNGPLLTLTVDGKTPGDVIDLGKPRKLKIEASAVGRLDFQELQLVFNGKVIQKKTAAKKAGYEAHLVHEMTVDEPGWFAVRTESATKNELGQALFAHTSPVYVDVAGQRPFDVEIARTLLKEVEEAQAAIAKQGRFTTPAAQKDLLALYDVAAADLVDRINKRGKGK
jgi:hypothetical protein